MRTIDQIAILLMAKGISFEYDGVWNRVIANGIYVWVDGGLFQTSQYNQRNGIDHWTTPEQVVATIKKAG